FGINAGAGRACYGRAGERESPPLVAAVEEGGGRALPPPGRQPLGAGGRPPGRGAAVRPVGVDGRADRGRAHVDLVRGGLHRPRRPAAVAVLHGQPRRGGRAAAVRGRTPADGIAPGRPAVVVHLPAGGGPHPVRPAGGQAVPAAGRAVLRLPAVPPADVHEQPGGAQRRLPVPPHGPP